jgi:hypothetical protein
MHSNSILLLDTYYSPAFHQRTPACMIPACFLHRSLQHAYPCIDSSRRWQPFDRSTRDTFYYFDVPTPFGPLYGSSCTYRTDIVKPLLCQAGCLNYCQPEVHSSSSHLHAFPVPDFVCIHSSNPMSQPACATCECLPACFSLLARLNHLVYTPCVWQ